MRRATPYLLLLTLGCGGGDDGGDDDDDDGVGSTDSGFLACGDQNCGDDELCVEVASGVNIYSQVCEPAPSCVPPRDERFGSDFCSSFDDCRDELAALCPTDSTFSACTVQGGPAHLTVNCEQSR